MSYRELLISEVQDELASSRKLLARVPANEWSYKPHSKSTEMGALASHLVDILEWGILTLRERDGVDLPPEYRPWEGKSPEALLRKFDESAAELKRLVAELDDERIDDMWTLKVNGNVIFTRPRLRVFRDMMMNHIIHHRAQLGVYLRLRSVPLPAVYGPSADEAVALL